MDSSHIIKPCPLCGTQVRAERFAAHFLKACRENVLKDCLLKKSQRKISSKDGYIVVGTDMFRTVWVSFGANKSWWNEKSCLSHIKKAPDSISTHNQIYSNMVNDYKERVEDTNTTITNTSVESPVDLLRNQDISGCFLFTINRLMMSEHIANNDLKKAELLIEKLKKHISQELLEDIEDEVDKEFEEDELSTPPLHTATKKIMPELNTNYIKKFDIYKAKSV